MLETLEAAPEEAVTPAAAVFALKRVAALEQGVKRRGKAGSFTVAAAEDNDFLRCVNRTIIILPKLNALMYLLRWLVYFFLITCRAVIRDSIHVENVI